MIAPSLSASADSYGCLTAPHQAGGRGKGVAIGVNTFCQSCCDSCDLARLSLDEGAQQQAVELQLARSLDCGYGREAVGANERSVASGYLEGSAVRPTLEMTALIEASRALEANVSLMKAQDEMLSGLVRRLLKA